MTKRKYMVFTKEYFVSEEHSRLEEWKEVGETCAASEKQAINNVRFRLFGKNGSQHKPMSNGSNWMNGLLWKAEII